MVAGAGLRWAQHYSLKPADGAPAAGRPKCGLRSTKLAGGVAEDWLSPNIWVRVPLTEIHQGDFSPLFIYAGDNAAGHWRRVAIRIKNRPWSTLNTPRCRSGAGFRRRCAAGASEVRSVTRAFNHMAAGVKQLADDRTLLMAGSATLRTPLTRIRLATDDGRTGRLSCRVDQ